MRQDQLNIDLRLSGEYLYFLKMVTAQTNMSYTEILTKMMELYKLVYLSPYELAHVEGDIIKTKYNTEDLKRKTFND